MLTILEVKKFVKIIAVGPTVVSEGSAKLSYFLATILYLSVMSSRVWLIMML